MSSEVSSTWEALQEGDISPMSIEDRLTRGDETTRQKPMGDGLLSKSPPPVCCDA